MLEPSAPTASPPLWESAGGAFLLASCFPLGVEAYCTQSTAYSVRSIGLHRVVGVGVGTWLEDVRR
jgi:hypothetical protein